MEAVAATELIILCARRSKASGGRMWPLEQDLDWNPGSITYKLSDFGQVTSLPLASLSFTINWG